MIPYDIDPSLHSGEPAPAVLDDGFSPPRARRARARRRVRRVSPGPRRGCVDSRILRRIMATHPVEPESPPEGPEPETPNPSHLPVEPDFGPVLPPAEPEDPGVKPPTV